jgi:hypothetical protein
MTLIQRIEKKKNPTQFYLAHPYIFIRKFM